MITSNNQKFKKVKYNFDRITSENSTNWKLVLFWILVFEFAASIIEFLYIDKSSSYSISIPHTLFYEIIVAISITVFVWFCIYNIVFENKNNIFKLASITIIATYFIITNDYTLQFLLLNLNPFHFFDLEFGVVFFIELFLKLLILYLLYQLIISFRSK